MDYEVVRSDRGGDTNLPPQPPKSEAERVFLLTTVTERDELGPEVPKSINPTSLLLDHLTLAQRADDAAAGQDTQISSQSQ